MIGIFFGIVLTKGEVVSWFRIQEMFRFDSFHMYGVIGTAVVASALIVFLMKKWNVGAIAGSTSRTKTARLQWTRLLVGGTIFGFGWAMTGACPGPLYILAGQGNMIILVVLMAAFLGALTYGAFRPRLPH